MSWAYKTSSPSWSRHDERGVWSLTLTASGAEAGGLDKRELLRKPEYEEHGLWMWSAWYIGGLILLVSKRYVKKHWELMHYIHAFVGYFVLAITIIFIVKISKWEPHGLHTIVGYICVIITIPGALTGSVTATLMRVYNGDKDWAEKEKVTYIAKIHRWFGYVMLALGCFSISSGLGNYYGEKLEDDPMKVLAPLNATTFVILIIIFEVIYRVRNKFSLGQVKTPSEEKSSIKSYTPEQLDEEVKAGKPLVVFDNLVLDMAGYERNHPGGKFVLTHNYGRDISKFFFGGYNLVQVPGLRPHHHSQAALDIVRTMIVGVIKGQFEVSDRRFRIAECNKMSDNTATFTFETIDDGATPVDNLKRWYNDPAMIGRHFLVFSAAATRIKRQYTICSSMNPAVMTALIKFADTTISA